MQDQASKLRNLVSRMTSVDGAPRARQVVISGCKGGVGTTTLAINVAISLRRHYGRVLLVDANPARGDVATMCRMNGAADIDDVLVGRDTVQRAIVGGPAGVQVLPRFGLQLDTPAVSCRRLIRHLDEVNRSYDCLIVDAGSCPLTAEALWPTAEHAVVVTTTDHVAVTNAYSLVKSMTRQHGVTDIGFIVNKFADEALARDVSGRLRHSCTRFLEIPASSLGWVPRDQKVSMAATQGRMVTCAFPDAGATMAIAQVADQLAGADIDSHSLNLLGVA